MDVGVGLGRLLNAIRTEAEPNPKIAKLDLHGMDISLPYLKIAYQTGLNVILAKIEDMPYTEEQFDLIICTDVLEHVVDLNLCIDKILSVLKPGGLLIVRVPNREDLSLYLRHHYPYNMAHIRAFDEYSLELLFVKVFKMIFFGKSPGLLMENQPLLKYKLPVKGYNLLLTNPFRITKMLNKSLYRRFLAVMYHPTEINAVFKKPAE